MPQAERCLRVAAGLLTRDGRVFLARRGPHGPCAGLWEFPGGKCHDGEDLGACLKREMAEELGLLVEVGEVVGRVSHDYGCYTVDLHLLRVFSSNGEPKALECAEWRWVFFPDEVLGMELCPADRRVVEGMSFQGLAGRKG
ncbi:MAG: (deoxy)nucleoside triphosphate pyrophosphohydrolase [Pseudomonadota bacterium]